MSETLARPEYTPAHKTEVETPTTEQLNIIVNGETPAPDNVSQETAVSVEDVRETSRPANMLRRIADFFERRAVSKAHSAALEEWRRTDTGGYHDHLDSLIESSDESQQAFGQNLLDRERARAERQEKLDQAADFTRKVGANALEAAKTTGLVTLGLGLLAGEQIGKGAKAASEKTKSAIEFGTQGYYDTVEGIKSDLRDTRDTIADTITETRDAVVEKAVDIRDTVKEKLISFANAAKERRDARRAKWSARKEAAIQWFGDRKEAAVAAGNAIKESVLDTIETARDKTAEIADTARDKATEAIGETQKRVQLARAAGSAAVEAALSTYRTLENDQKTHK